MRAFAQKQNQPQQKSSANLTRSNTRASAARQEAHPLRQLQHSIGNQAVLRLLQVRADGLEAGANPKDAPTTEVGSKTPATRRFALDFSRMPLTTPDPITIQPKLAINTPGDVYEQEADQIAEQVMRMPEPQLQRACACGGGCASCQTEQPSQQRQRLQTQHVGSGDAERTAAPPLVDEVLASHGQLLDASARAFFEPRFEHDFSRVRVHADQRGADSARAVAADAFTVGEHIVFGQNQYAPSSTTARHLLAHELTHVVQQRAGGRALQRRASNCPAKEPMPPTIKTMADFIALVRRVEESTSTGKDPIATARLISRTKYEGSAWDWLLPSTKGQAGTVAGGKVTADDIGSLCFKLVVSLPDGSVEDPMHVIAAIVADAETVSAGTGATGLSGFVNPLPASVSQRSASTWVGDVGKAAAEWMTAHPLPSGGEDKVDYMLENAGPRDLLANVEGIAITSKSAPSGFAFDKTKPLSDNLQQFYTPAKGTGRERRFHIFCSVEGFALEKDGVTLTAGAKTAIGQRVKDFAEWYQKNDPALLKWRVLVTGNWSISKKWVNRAGDWQWFADTFIKFLQNFLAKEGP